MHHVRPLTTIVWEKNRRVTPQIPLPGEGVKFCFRDTAIALTSKQIQRLVAVSLYTKRFASCRRDYKDLEKLKLY